MSKPIVPYLPPQHPTLSKDQTQKKSALGNHCQRPIRSLLAPDPGWLVDVRDALSAPTAKHAKQL